MHPNLHFIKAPCHQNTYPKGCELAPQEIKEKYDFQIIEALFNNEDNQPCKGYQLLYEYILKYSTNNPTNKIITIGGDHSISASSIAAMNEKYLIQRGNHIDSELMVLWIDCFSDIESDNPKNLNEMPVGSLLGLNNLFIKNKLLLKKDQLIYFGLVDSDNNLDNVKELRIPYFSLNKINTIGLEDCTKNIIKMIGNKKLHISLDMKVFNSNIVKSVIPENPKGLLVDDIINLLSNLKNNIVSMDIVEFNPNIGTNENIKTTRNIIKNILTSTFDIKEKSINIFTEDSFFLIFRSARQENPLTDIGWYIMRGLTLEMRNNLISIIIIDDDIISFDMDSETFLISKTTIKEQNNKSYYAAKTINDVALYPQEKESMGFELLNSC
jgi:arginase family enzyme